MRERRSGITLIETLVVIGIIGLLFAILIPAVQYARESARRSACQNNLRQQAIAIQAHESSHRSLPRLYYGTFLKQPRYALDEFHFHSWRTAILPELEQGALYQQIDLSLPASDVANQTNLNVVLPVFICPSTSNPTPTVPDVMEINNGAYPVTLVGTAARSDYEAIGGVYAPPHTSDTDQN